MGLGLGGGGGGGRDRKPSFWKGCHAECAGGNPVEGGGGQGRRSRCGGVAAPEYWNTN